MLKRLAIFAVVLSIAQASVPTSGQTSNARTSNPQHPKKRANAAEKPSLPAVSVATPQQSNTPTLKDNSAQKEQADTQQTVVVSEFPPVTIKHVGFDWNAFANYLLVAVGIGGIAVAVCTLRKLERQNLIAAKSAHAANKAANAALAQVKHMFADQRPWMAVRVYDESIGRSLDGKWHQRRLTITAKNRGKSPAKITMFMAEKICIHPKDTNEGPKFSTDGRFDEAQWRFPKGYFTVGGNFDFTEEMISEAQREGKFTLFQGFVRYEDTLSSDVHETRFCYQAFIENDRYGLRMYTAKGYNIMT